jgi:hypothetical protein
MTHRSSTTQKHNFGVMCPGVFFVESVPHPSIKIVCHRFAPRIDRNALRDHVSHRMEKHIFCVTSPSLLFRETALSQPEHEK